MRTTAAALTLALFVTLPPGPVEAAPPKTDGLTPLTIEVPQKTLDRIKKQVAAHRWLESRSQGR